MISFHPGKRPCAQLVAVLLLAFPVASCAANAPPEACEAFDFTCGDIPVLTQSALEGDAHAALKLSRLYADRDDKRAQVFWTRVAIENGSVIARHNYAGCERMSIRAAGRDPHVAAYPSELSASRDSIAMQTTFPGSVLRHVPV